MESSWAILLGMLLGGALTLLGYAAGYLAGCAPRRVAPGQRVLPPRGKSVLPSSPPDPQKTATTEKIPEGSGRVSSPPPPPPIWPQKYRGTP